MSTNRGDVRRVSNIFLLAVLAAAGCGAVTPDEGVEVAELVSPVGGPLPGLTQAQLDRFNEGQDQFSEVEGIDVGIGPFFNGRACGECHTVGAVGGAGKQLEVRAGKLTNGVFDSLTAQGGQLFDLFSVTSLPPRDRTAIPGCALNPNGVPVPAAANVKALRRTTALFGLGLVDATPDATFKLIAAFQSSDIRGRAPLVENIAAGHPTVGKFGWKDQNPTLVQFAGDAYRNEMGITNPEFPTEQTGGVTKPEQLDACDTIPGIENDEDVPKFTDFMTFLAPPARGPSNIQSALGDFLFTAVGCAGCHVRSIVSGSSPVAALSRKEYRPFSDFLVHDMGSLGDNIGNNGTALPREMRTAPLWGLRFLDQGHLLHDGRGTSLSDAILKHAGQGLAARNRFAALSSISKQNLLAFLNTL
jgi:CxxC motif-containing protein (DUF1111 family)